MKFVSERRPLRPYLLALGLLVAGLLSVKPAFAAEKPVEDPQLRKLGEAVLQLLTTGNVEKFAADSAPSLEDWRGVLSTNATSAQGEDPLDAVFQRNLEGNRKQVVASARGFLEKGNQLGADASHVRFRLKDVVAPVSASKVQYPFMKKGEMLPWMSEVKLVLTGEGVTNADAKFTGDYEVSVQGVTKFPGGWRFNQGLRWSRFPDTLIDSRAKLEMELIEKASAGRSIKLADDPAIREFGLAVIEFVQKHDLKVFEQKVMPSLDDIWKMTQEHYGGKGGPSRQQLEESWKDFADTIVASGKQMLAQTDNAGINFTNAEITLDDVVTVDPHARGMVEANAIKVLFTVKSDQAAKTGKPIAGKYSIRAGRSVRLAGGKWGVQDKVRWMEFPAGVLGEKELAEQQFETYVAEHRTLPPGTAAPEIEFVRLDDGSKGKLSDFRGKVVVLDFWATWCGPCQEPMAHLQTEVKEHPQWKDKVVVASLSIDDTDAIVKAHLAKRDWTNTFNLWAGKGGWKSEAPKTYRVTGVPTTYIIDAEGKIARAGHPAGMQIPSIVESLIK